MPSTKYIAKDTVQIQSHQFPLAFSLDKVTPGGASLFHEEIELKYIISGNLTMLLDNKSVSAQAGDIIFINPFEIHSNVLVQEDTAVYHVAVISLDFFSGNNFYTTAANRMARKYLPEAVTGKDVIQWLQTS